jgi:rhamnogalacturonyl hydrolase YesR
LLTKDPLEKESLMNDAVNQVFTFNNQVWDAEHSLYRQAQYSDIKIKIPFWSRANGWALWAVTEVLAHLPKNHPKYKVVLAHYKTHINTLIKHQDSTGFWHNLIDYPDTFLETSGTAIFTMAIAKGINNGWLDRKKYLPAAMQGWKAIETVVDDDGTLHGTCIGTNMSENVKDYYTRPVADDDTHGILPVLFAGIEVDKLLSKK